MVSRTDTYTFISNEEYFDDEKSGKKNNTVREIDLNDDRFQDLMIAWKKGILPKIRINKKQTMSIKPDEAINIFEDKPESFLREIQHIAVYKTQMVITWEHSPIKA